MLALLAMTTNWQGKRKHLVLLHFEAHCWQGSRSEYELTKLLCSGADGPIQYSCTDEWPNYQVSITASSVLCYAVSDVFESFLFSFVVFPTPVKLFHQWQSSAAGRTLLSCG